MLQKIYGHGLVKYIKLQPKPYNVETLVISLGSNQGDRIARLTDAIQRLKLQIGEIIRVSPVYESAPWGFIAEQYFLNCTISILTGLPPDVCLQKCLINEGEMGRIRQGNGYEPRPIDIDILFYGNLVLQTPDLEIPHPRLHMRRFVLVPLCQTEPDLMHPVLNKTIRQLCIECRDTAEVRFFASADRIFNPNT